MRVSRLWIWPVGFVIAGLGAIFAPSSSMVIDHSKEFKPSNEAAEWVEIVSKPEAPDLTHRSLFWSNANESPAPDIAPEPVVFDEVEPLGFRLVGIVNENGRNQALFETVNTNSRVKLIAGGKIDGWKVSRILGSSVTLSKDGEPQTLQLFQP